METTSEYEKIVRFLAKNYPKIFTTSEMVYHVITRDLHPEEIQELMNQLPGELRLAIGEAITQYPPNDGEWNQVEVPIVWMASGLSPVEIEQRDVKHRLILRRNIEALRRYFDVTDEV